MDFRPETLARREEPWEGHVRLTRPPSVRVVSGVSAAFVVATACFLALGTYTRRVHASGEMLPAGGILRVEAPAAGTVTASAIREGAPVRAGEVIYTIDVDPTSSDGATAIGVLRQLERQTAILRGQRVIEIRTSADRKGVLQDQLVIQLRQQREVERELAAQAPLLDASRVSWIRTTSAFEQHLATQSAMQDGTIGYAQLLTTHAQYLQTAYAIDDKVVQLRSDLRMADDEAATRVSAIDKETAALDQQIAETRARHAIRVLAPANGVMAAVLVDAGQTVRTGTRLASLIPEGRPLRAELYVGSEAIGLLRPGERVRLRYEAFPYQRYGLQAGTVAEVSRAPATGTETADAPDGTDRRDVGLYRVMVTPKSARVRVGTIEVPVQAGMAVQADIGVERRTLLRWLLGPIQGLRTSAGLVGGEGRGA